MGRTLAGWIATVVIATVFVASQTVPLIPDQSPAQAADPPRPTRGAPRPLPTEAVKRNPSASVPSHPAAPQAVKNSPQSPPLEGPPLQDVPTWSQLARAILLTAIPDKYVDKKHWGMTREIFDGLHVEQRGLNIRVSERRRKVNHGSWYMFTVRFPQPEQNVKLVIDQVQSHGPGKFSFAIHVAMKNIRLHGQFEQWILGVKGPNFDFESDVEVHMHAVVQLAIHTERKPGSLLPDLVLDPSIRSIRLDLVDVNTRRIGRVGGGIAEELGDSSRKLFEDLIHSQEGRVLKKANEAIQKKRDSLRLPVSKLW
jgi:hypothetical protein